MRILLFLSQPHPGDINVASHLRKSIYRSAAINAALVLMIGLATAAMTHSLDLGSRNLLVLLLATLLIGTIAAWVKMHSIVENLLRLIPKASTWCRVPRGQPINGINIDWQAMDAHAAQLKTLGFLHVGDFSPWPLGKHMASVSAMYGDSNATTLLEIRCLQAAPHARATAGQDDGIYFSIFTVLGGNIRVTTTNHAPQARDYLMRSVGDVMAAYPGQSLTVLLEKHRRLIQNLRERTAQGPVTGLSMKRYVLLQRERFEWVRLRLRELGGYKVSVEYDWFEANPALNYAPSSATLAALPCRGLDALDTSPLAQTAPPLREWDESQRNQNKQVYAATGKDAQTESGDAPDTARLHQQVARAANWFYWIAALSVFNFVAEAIGSNWGFALGLGLSQLLGVGAKNFLASEAPGAAVFAMYAAAAGSIAFFAACGWFARKPSVFVFMVGIVFFALDTLIFLIALDGMGIAIHLVALYFLRQGVPAARTLRADEG
ncbi:MAG: hypothetical protein RL748_1099 [Pseudomonadota bacterium]|jgi:hypothetical protein